jgi:hypothetical protein
VYLIRWKVCWIFRSNIDDVEWVLASLEANKNRHCRRSARLSSTEEERSRINEAIMLVVRLEVDRRNGYSRTVVSKLMVLFQFAQYQTRKESRNVVSFLIVL